MRQHAALKDQKDDKNDQKAIQPENTIRNYTTKQRTPKQNNKQKQKFTTTPSRTNKNICNGKMNTLIIDMNNFLRRKKAERDRNFFGKKKTIVEGKFKKIILENTSLAVTGALAHCLHCLLNGR